MTPGPAFYTLAVVAEMLQCTKRYVQLLADEAGFRVARYGRASDHPRRLRMFLPREVATLARLKHRNVEKRPTRAAVKQNVLRTSLVNLTREKSPQRVKHRP